MSQQQNSSSIGRAGKKDSTANGGQGSSQAMSTQNSISNGTQSETQLRSSAKAVVNQQSSTTNQVQHQYSAHYTGGESSSSKRPQEMSALDRLKCIQNNFRQQWNGINCEISGRPGKSLLL